MLTKKLDAAKLTKMTRPKKKKWTRLDGEGDSSDDEEPGDDIEIDNVDEEMDPAPRSAEPRLPLAQVEAPQSRLQSDERVKWEEE